VTSKTHLVKLCIWKTETWSCRFFHQLIWKICVDIIMWFAPFMPRRVFATQTSQNCRVLGGFMMLKFALFGTCLDQSRGNQVKFPIWQQIWEIMWHDSYWWGCLVKNALSVILWVHFYPGKESWLWCKSTRYCELTSRYTAGLASSLPRLSNKGIMQPSYTNGENDAIGHAVVLRTMRTRSIMWV
jgi:hypothetical protein